MWRPLDVNEAHSLLGMIIQGVGIALLALLSFFLARSVKRLFLDYWAMAWACLALALLALFLSFRLPPLSALLEGLYYVGEYGFGILLVAGCRSFATGARLGRRDLWVVAVAVVLGLVVMPRTASDFTFRFIPQSILLAAIFVAALVQVERARRVRGATPGIRLTSVALVILALNFLHYAPVLAYSMVNHVTLPLAYAAYTSIYDLILEVVLAFGTVTLVMEDARAEVERSNRDLLDARDRLEVVARMDPLTQSLNRHAFYSLVEGSRTPDASPPAGCVAVVDVDGLKPINDSHGHAAGDAVIRAVARAIRSLVRADDLVFRWGGDEFLVVLFGVSEDETRRRLSGLDAQLATIEVPGAARPLAVTVSSGVAGFAPGASLEQATEAADQAMYAHKQQRRARREQRPSG